MAGYYHICPEISLSSLSGHAGVLWGQKCDDFGSFCSAMYLNSSDQLELSGQSTTIYSTCSSDLFTVCSTSGTALQLKQDDCMSCMNHVEMTLFGDLSVTGVIWGSTGGTINVPVNYSTGLCGLTGSSTLQDGITACLGVDNTVIRTTGDQCICNNLTIYDVGSEADFNMRAYSNLTSHTASINFGKSSCCAQEVLFGATVNNDVLGELTFSGTNSAQDAFAQGANIYAKQNGTAGDSIPADLYLTTCNLSSNNACQLVLHNSGSIGIGTTNPDQNYLLDICGSINADNLFTQFNIHDGTNTSQVGCNGYINFATNGAIDISLETSSNTFCVTGPSFPDNTLSANGTSLVVDVSAVSAEMLPALSSEYTTGYVTGGTFDNSTDCITFRCNSGCAFTVNINGYDYDSLINKPEHDNLVGFVANEHIDHTSVSFNGIKGIEGGGDISSSRTFCLSGQALCLHDATFSNSSLLAKNSSGTLTSVTTGSVVNGSGSIPTSNDVFTFVASVSDQGNVNIDHSTVSFAGTGGIDNASLGDITTSRTVQLSGQARCIHDLNLSNGSLIAKDSNGNYVSVLSSTFMDDTNTVYNPWVLSASDTTGCFIVQSGCQVDLVGSEGIDVCRSNEQVFFSLSDNARQLHDLTLGSCNVLVTDNSNNITQVNNSVAVNLTALSGDSSFTLGDTLDIGHADTSSQASITSSSRTYIDSVTLDDYGHVTGLTTATETAANGDVCSSSGTANYVPLWTNGTTISNSCLCQTGTTIVSKNDLCILGNLTVQGTTTTLNTEVCTTSAMEITNAGTGPALQLNQTGSQPIVDFQDDGTSAFYIEDGGNVGIGTNNPNTNLTVVGNISASTLLYDGNNNSSQWTDAYNNYICDISVSGTGTKTITLTQRDGGTITTNFTDNDTVYTHPNVSSTSSHSGCSVGYGGTFTVVCALSATSQGHTCCVGTMTITLPASDENDTTYDISASSTTGGANLNLNAGGSGSGTDSVKLASGTGITVSFTDASTITINHPSHTAITCNCSNGIVLQDITVNDCGHVTSVDTINLNDIYFTESEVNTCLNAKQDTLTFGIANTNALKVDDADAADNDYAKFTANGLEGRSDDEVRNDLGLGTIYSCAATDFDKYTAWRLYTDTTDRGDITSGEQVRFCGGTDISLGYAATNNVITINHDTVSSTSSHSGCSVGYGGTFTVVCALSATTQGHTCCVGTMTVTLPASDENDTTYDISASSTTGGANLNLNAGGSGSGTDSVKLASGTGITVSFTDASTITINHPTQTAITCNCSNGTVLQDITVNDCGHVTSVGVCNLDDRYYTETEVDTCFSTCLDNYLLNTTDTLSGTLETFNSGDSSCVSLIPSGGSPYVLLNRTGSNSWKIKATGNGSAQTLDTSLNDTSIFTIEAGGNVGIGTTNPNTTLTVSGSISASSTICENGKRVCTANYPTVGAGCITLNAGTDLSTGGGFNVNQAGAATITIDHSDITRTDTTSTASPANGGTVSVIDSITSNARGHITAANVKTITLPSNAANADTVGGFSASQFVRSDANDTKTGNLDFTSNGACLSLSNYGRVGIGMNDPQNPLEICLGDNSTFTTGLVFVKNSGNRGTRGHASGSALFQYCFSDHPGMILDKDGNVGIGTNDPNGMLEMRSSTANCMIFGYPVGSGAAHSLTWDSSKVYICADPANGTANSGIGFSVDNDIKMFIDDGGNVGIGTTSPYAKLQVNGSTQTFNAHFGQGQNNGSGNWGGISLGYSENNNLYRKVGIVAKAIGDSAARQELHFLVDSVNDAANATLTDSKMMIDINGNVGISTTGPGTTKLRVVNGSSGQEIFKADDGATAVIRAKVDGTVTFEKGNVGIGTTDPGSDRLKVSGTVCATSDISTEGNSCVDGTSFWFVNDTDRARQRADARDDATNFARLHWYGQNDAGSTSNFRHAWYDGAAYIHVTATNCYIDFDRTSCDTCLKVDGTTIACGSTLYSAGAQVCTAAYPTDASTLDGIDSSSFVRSDTSDTVSGATYTFDSTSTNVKLYMCGHAGAASYNYFLNASNDGGVKAVHFVNGSTRTADGGANAYTIRNDGGPFILGRSTYATCLCGSALTYNGNTVWHAGNDGAGSGLHADCLDGQEGAYYLNYNNFTNTPTIPTDNSQLANSCNYCTTDTNTTYSVTTVDVAGSASAKLRLSGSDSTTDDITFAVSQNLTIEATPASDLITITGPDLSSYCTTDTNTTYTASTGLTLVGTAFSISSTCRTAIANGATAHGWGNHALAGYTTCGGDITNVIAGTGLNGGGTSGDVTLSLPSVITAGTYGSTGNSCKIDTITVDAQGRVTAIACGATGSSSANYYVNSVAFATGTGVLTLGRSGLGDLTVDLDGRYCTSDTNTNYYVNSVAFATGTGVLTLGRSGLVDLTIDLDGRYCTSNTNNYASCIGFNTTTGVLSIGREGLTDLTIDLDGRYCTTTGSTLAGGNCISIVSGDINHDTGGAGAANYSNNAGTGNGILGIEVDAYGHVLSVNSGTITTCTSDYRAKTCIQSYDVGYDAVKNVDTYKYVLIDQEEDEQHAGLMAHELQEAGVDYGVTGTKDEVDDAGQPVYQTVDYTRLVPTLWSALKTAINKIEDLETRLATLELQSNT